MIKIQLRRPLEEAGIRQSELARATGIRPSTICDLCSGNASFVKLEQLYKIYSFLNCGIEDILKLENEFFNGGLSRLLKTC